MDRRPMVRQAEQKAGKLRLSVLWQRVNGSGKIYTVYAADLIRESGNRCSGRRGRSGDG